MAEHDEIMKRMAEKFKKHMQDILFSGDSGTTYTTTQAQPSEPLTVEHLEKAMELLRSKVPPNPYQQYIHTHEWHFPARLQREIQEALQPPAASLFYSPLVERFSGIPIVWDDELVDRCELRPSPERIARYQKQLEMQAEMNIVNNRFLMDELTQQEFSIEIGQIMERFLLERTDPGGDS